MPIASREFRLFSPKERVVRAAAKKPFVVAPNGSRMRTIAPLTKDVVSSASGRIVKDPGYVGGKPRIRGTRIAVWVLANYRRLGMTDAELLTAYPSLTHDDLSAAWIYADENAPEIDQAIRKNEEGEEGFAE